MPTLLQECDMTADGRRVDLQIRIPEHGGTVM